MSTTTFNLSSYLPTVNYNPKTNTLTISGWPNRTFSNIAKSTLLGFGSIYGSMGVFSLLGRVINFSAKDLAGFEILPTLDYPPILLKTLLSLATISSALFFAIENEKLLKSNINPSDSFSFKTELDLTPLVSAKETTLNYLSNLSLRKTNLLGIGLSATYLYGPESLISKNLMALIFSIKILTDLDDKSTSNKELAKVAALAAGCTIANAYYPNRSLIIAFATSVLWNRTCSSLELTLNEFKKIGFWTAISLGTETCKNYFFEKP